MAVLHFVVGTLEQYSVDLECGCNPEVLKLPCLEGLDKSDRDELIKNLEKSLHPEEMKGSRYHH